MLDYVEIRYAGALWVREDCKIIVQFVGLSIKDLVIKAKNDGVTSGSLKLQCIAIADVDHHYSEEAAGEVFTFRLEKYHHGR